MKDFLTPARRKAIYGLMTAVITVLVVFGVITQEQIDGVIANVASVSMALTTLMAFMNTNPED